MTRKFVPCINNPETEEIYSALKTFCCLWLKKFPIVSMWQTPKTQSAQGEGSLLTAGNYFESGKSECNNSGYKLTGLTWWT